MIELGSLQSAWVDEPDYHKSIHESFIEIVNSDTHLKEHRDWVEANVFGFGERSFHFMWKCVIDDMPSEFSFMEVGVFRGQVLSLVKILAMRTGRKVERTGVTPLIGIDGYWESDYKADIELIHDTFLIPKDYEILVGLSTESKIIEQASKKQYDIMYIDGGHTKEVVESDLRHYSQLIKRGGLLVIDDCASDLNMPWGYFQGHQQVTDAVCEFMKDNHEWEFLFNVVHVKCFRRL